VAAQFIMVGARAVEAAHLMAARKQREKKRKRPVSQYLLQWYPNIDLASFQ
jgi:hypothetical protein